MLDPGFNHQCLNLQTFKILTQMLCIDMVTLLDCTALDDYDSKEREKICKRYFGGLGR